MSPEIFQRLRALPDRASPFLVEASIWFVALVFLGVLPFENLPSFCIFRWMGVARCPGCGLGHAIHYALAGDFPESLKAHILGVPALFLIVWRINSLLRSHAQFRRSKH